MIEQGAIEEVRELLDLGLDPGLPAMRAHGVRELAAYLSGAVSREDAVAKAKTESRRYAKRQMTWATALHVRLAVVSRCCHCHRGGDRDARYTVTCVPISTTRSVGSWK